MNSYENDYASIDDVWPDAVPHVQEVSEETSYTGRADFSYGSSSR